LLSIAVDVQGAAVVKPYADKFHVTFPVAVDTADVFGRAFSLKAIPVSYLVDEVGIIRLQGAGPARDFLDGVEAVLKEPVTSVRGRGPSLPAGQPKAELEKQLLARPDEWRLYLALAQTCGSEGEFVRAIAACETASRMQPAEPSIPFTWGLVLLQQGGKEAALVKLKQARDLDPGNWRIRKQIWAIEHPDKYYADPSPDYGWQKEELARERTGR
jgi:tetratricopeptide (TPR) repeat protein